MYAQIENMSSADVHNVSEITHRIKTAYKLPSDAALARFLNVNTSTLANWKRRESLNYDLILEKCSDLDLNWLLRGEGVPRPAENEVHDRIAPYVFRGNSHVRIPIYEGPLGAGAGVDGSDAVVGYGDFVKGWLRNEVGISPELAFIVPVRGHSMTDLLLDGDLVLGERTDTVDRDGIFAVDYEGEIYVKHVLRGRTHFRLVSENRAYAEIVVQPEDSFRVIGRVVRKISRV